MFATCRKSSTPKEPSLPAHRGAPTEVRACPPWPFDACPEMHALLMHALPLGCPPAPAGRLCYYPPGAVPAQDAQHCMPRLPTPCAVCVPPPCLLTYRHAASLQAPTAGVQRPAAAYSHGSGVMWPYY